MPGSGLAWAIEKEPNKRQIEDTHHSNSPDHNLGDAELRRGDLIDKVSDEADDDD